MQTKVILDIAKMTMFCYDKYKHTIYSQRKYWLANLLTLLNITLFIAHLLMAEQASMFVHETSKLKEQIKQQQSVIRQCESNLSYYRTLYSKDLEEVKK